MRKNRGSHHQGVATRVESGGVENPDGTGGKAGPGTHPRMTDGIFAYHDRG